MIYVLFDGYRFLYMKKEVSGFCEKINDVVKWGWLFEK